METNDISLILLPSWGITEPPLALSSLASYLRTNGINVKIYDFNIELYHLLSNYRKWWNLAYGLDMWETESFIIKFWGENLFLFDILIEDVMKFKPKFVGFTVYVSNRYITEQFAQRLKIKYPDVTIIFGGPEISYIENISEYSERIPYVNYFVIGEGEEPLLKIVRGLESEHISQASESINLNTLPLLDLSDFHFEAYLDSLGFPMYSSRGCPNRCIYCTERIHMKRFRARSAKRIFNDVITQKQKYPYLKTFRLQESTCNGNPKQLEKFADLMIKANLRLTWAMNNAVLRKEMDLHLFKKIRKAGCRFINFGLETPSHRVLEIIGKILAKNADFEKIVREAHRVGINVGLCVMFGLPGETEEDFQLQLDFLKKNHQYISIVAPSLWFCYFPKQSEGFQNPTKYGLDLELGSLYWKDREGTNNYLVRLERFVKYTNLLKKFRVSCAFGYDTLPNPDKLIEQYCSELQRLGQAKPNNLDEIRKSIKVYKARNPPKRTETLVSAKLSASINKIIFLLPKMRYGTRLEKNLEKILNLLLQKGISLDMGKRNEKEARMYKTYENLMVSLKQKYSTNLGLFHPDPNIFKKIVFEVLYKLSPTVINELRHHAFKIKILEEMVSKMIQHYLDLNLKTITLPIT